jgi:uncharacterized protein
MLRRLLTVLPLVSLLAAPALANKVPAHGTLIVHDDAAAFTAEGVAAAKKAFAAVDFKHATKYVVKTVKDVPAARKADFDAVKKDKDQFHRFMRDWAEELAKAEGNSPDIYALVLVNDKNAYQVHVHTNRQSSVHGHFGDAKANQAAGKLSTGFEAVLKSKLTGDEAKKERDGSLLASVNFVADAMKDSIVPDAGSRGHAVNTNHNNNGGGSSIMSYVCIGLVVLMGVWLVIGLIRALTGGGGGGGMGGGGFGGGGGGFMSSLLGGMFGSMAGMWMYDSFFGGHHSSDYGSSSAGYDNGGGDGNYDTGANDYAGGSSGDAGGGDWGDSGGDNAGGGDWGGGGGDFGGGDW